MMGKRFPTIPLFVLLMLVYPFAHNSCVYALNYVFWMTGSDLGRLNVILLGWKDAVLLFLTLFLILRRRLVQGVLCLGLVCFYVYGNRIDALKELVLPFMSVLTCAFYRKEIRDFFERNRSWIYRIIFGVLLVILAAGFGEYGYRVIKKITSSNWTQHEYLVVNNRYRCAKGSVYSGSQDGFDRCLRSRLNFYKLGHRDGEYKAHQVLFLPVGDSVVFSFLLLYGLVLWMAKTQGRIGGRWRDCLVFIVLLYSIMLCLNRMNALIALAITVISAGFWLMARKDVLKQGVCLLALVVFYAHQIGYLLVSLFDRETPSNLGHVEAVEALVNIPWVVIVGGAIVFVGIMALMMIWLARARALYRWMCYSTAVAVAYFMVARSLHGSSVSLWGIPGALSTESNFLKVLVNYGVVGAALYAFILVFIMNEIARLVGLLALFVRKRRTGLCVQVCGFVILGCGVLFYQFFSPYIISGYVVFSIFISMLVIFSEMIHREAQGQCYSRLPGD